jgi:hypothetical protein
VFNNKKNTVAVHKIFFRESPGIRINKYNG